MFSHAEYSEIPKMKDCDFRFYRRADGLYDVTLRLETNNPMVLRAKRGEDGALEIVGMESIFENDTTIIPELNQAWYTFMQRPEYLVKELTIESTDRDYLQDLYERLLVGVAFIRAGRNPKYDPDDAWQKINRCLEWLRTTDFYTCPASTIYHNAYPSGLVHHTLLVVQKIVEISKLESFKDYVRLEDAILVAMIHDWCKIGLYDPYIKNVKNNDTGKWEAVSAYKYKDSPMSNFGHGVSSMFLAQQYFKLSVEEALAVRWHMGWTRVVESEMNELQHANETYPLVHLLQFADQLSIVNY